MPETYTPPFEITDTIIHLISEISKQLGKISAEKTFDKNPRLRKINRIHSIHSSLAIENNSLTLSQVTDIIDGKAVIGPYNEILEVKNAAEAYKLLPSLNPYSEADLQNTHKIMMNRLIDSAGQYRTTGVGVFSGNICVHLAPPPFLVKKEMEDLVNWCCSTQVHPLIKSSVFHFELEFIHPFTDGNGRMGRLWQTLILSKWDPAFIWIPIETLILGKQQEYYDALAQAGKCGKSTVFIEFMLQLIHEALTSAAENPSDVGINVGINEEKILIEMRKNPSVTAREIAEITSLAPRQVERLISRLKEQGLICRTGAKKNGQWVLVNREEQRGQK